MAARDDHVRTVLAERIAAARVRLLGGLKERTEELAVLAEATVGDRK